jgi:uncharacterized membrane protein HdeD (DUF308 family)
MIGVLYIIFGFAFSMAGIGMFTTGIGQRTQARDWTYAAGLIVIGCCLLNSEPATNVILFILGR